MVIEVLGPIQSSGFTCAVLNSNLDLPKLKKVRLLIQTSNLLGRSLKSFSKTIPYCKRFQAKLETIYALKSAHEKFDV